MKQLARETEEFWIHSVTLFGAVSIDVFVRAEWIVYKHK